MYEKLPEIVGKTFQHFPVYLGEKFHLDQTGPYGSFASSFRNGIGILDSKIPFRSEFSSLGIEN